MVRRLYNLRIAEFLCENQTILYTFSTGHAMHGDAEISRFIGENLVEYGTSVWLPVKKKTTCVFRHRWFWKSYVFSGL